MKKNNIRKTLLPLLLLLLLWAVQRYGSVRTPEAVPETAAATLDGEPSFAAPVMAAGDGILIEHEGFSLLFDTEMLCPRWVAWELTAEETRGSVTREGVDFKADIEVPKQYRVEMYDYNGGSYGRGHMCPAGDMKWSQEAMQDCHYMTNICPQTAELNRNWWEHLERACRQWARQEGSVQIVCGPIFSSRPKRFGKTHKVAVPEAFYKVVLSLKKGSEKAIGFYYLNNDERQPMEEAVRSVDEIEALTGIDFFSSLPDKLEDALEATPDLRAWDE